MNSQMTVGLTLALLTGCASIERTSPGMMDGLEVMGGDAPAEQTVCARVSGFGLFYLFTAICGDVSYNRREHDIEGGCLVFQDRCNGADCYRTLQAVANDQGKLLTNVSMVNNSLPSQGVTGWADLAGWFVEVEDVACSGVLRAKQKGLVTK